MLHKVGNIFPRKFYSEVQNWAILFRNVSKIFIIRVPQITRITRGQYILHFNALHKITNQGNKMAKKNNINYIKWIKIVYVWLGE